MIETADVRKTSVLKLPYLITNRKRGVEPENNIFLGKLYSKSKKG